MDGEPAGKYARFELERRFLLGRVPEGIDPERGWRITDRYLPNTHLRLRRMEPLHGGATVFKLAQKQAPSPPDFARMTITNIYIAPVEYAMLAELEALEIRKVRYPIESDGNVFGVDVFEDRLAGLVLAEVGFETQTELDRPIALPSWVMREVSDDVRFTGGALAALTAAEAADLLGGLAAT